MAAATQGRAIPATGRFDVAVAVAAAVAVGAAFALWGVGVETLAAGVGAALAVVNWLSFRWLVVRLLARTPAGAGARRGPVAGLLVLKILGLLVGLYLLVAVARLDPVALALGYSALVAGLLVAALLAPGGADA